MPDFLSDPPSTAYLVLAALVVVTGVVAARYQDRKRAAPFLLALLLLGGLYLLDRVYASPREETVASIGGMLDAVNRRDTDAFLGHVSDSFDANGVKKADLRRAAELAGQFNAKVVAWNFDRNQVVTRDGPPAAVDVVFDAKAEGPGGTVPKHVKATFVRDPDGKFRMRTFATYNIVNKKEAEPIPGVSK
jgi:hypothetical protein